MSAPRQLGPYRLGARLGQGGMAQVFLATGFGASGFEKQIAVKVLRPELEDDPELQKLLIEEAKLGARLRHRNVVQVHGLGTDGGVYYVCLDYVDGADLGTLRQRRPLPGELALLIMEELVVALDYAHHLRDEQGRPLGLVHRDVSPSNVLLSRSGEVKLADFGIAKATKLRENTRAGIRRGKYAYMSPEQVAGRPLSAQSDQFSVAVVLVELFAGRRPFDGETPSETMDRIREAQPPPLTRWPEDLAAIAHQCLRRDPRERFADTRALMRALAEARHRRITVSVADLADWVKAALGDDQRASSLPARPKTQTMTD